MASYSCSDKETFFKDLYALDDIAYEAETCEESTVGIHKPSSAQINGRTSRRYADPSYP
jgi:hypothetical protein